MSGQPTVALAGLSFSVDVAVPQLPAGRDEPDVRVIAHRPSPVPNELPDGEILAHEIGTESQTWYALVRTAHGYRMRLPAFADIVVDADVRTIEYRPHSAEQAELLPIVAGGLLPALAHTLRGAHVLHGTAVDIGGSALAFVGWSGAGKTTLAAIMCRSGAELVADDVLVVGGDPPVVQPGARELRLRPKARSLAWGDTCVSVDGRTVLRPAAADRAVPLRAVVQPWPDPTRRQVDFYRLPAPEAVAFLMAQTRIAGWRHPEYLRRSFAHATALAAAVPVVQLAVPWGPPFADDLADQVVSAIAGCT